MPKSASQIIVLSGPSGSGKTTLCRELAARRGLYFSISHTTRKPREGEKNGLAYHFVDLSEFKKMEVLGELIESAEVYGNCYGTSLGEVEKGMQKGVILDLDTQGALAMKKKYPTALLIFIRPPSHEDLHARLSQRGTESKEVLARRLKQAGNEEQFQKYYDAVVTNKDLNQALNELELLINKNSLNI